MPDEHTLLESLQNKVKNFKNFKYLNYILGIAFVLSVVSPSAGIMFGASSMAQGLLLVILLCFIAALTVLPFGIITVHIQSAYKLVTIILAFVLAHGLINYLLHVELFDITRFLLSFVYLIIFIFGAFSFTLVVKKMSIKKSNFILYFAFISFVMMALLSSFGFSPFQVGGKPVIFYSEPSHYALDFLPILLFIVVQAERKNKIICLLIAFEISLLVQNLTLMVGVILVTCVALRLRDILLAVGLYTILYYSEGGVHSFLSFVNSSSEHVVHHSNISSYLSARLPPVSGSVSGSVSESVLGSINGSFLVYFSGWERAYLNLFDYFGFGTGFQQLGVIGSEGEAMKRITYLYHRKLGLYDGGAVAPKFLSEFGVLALFFIAIYVTYFFKVIKKIRLISISSPYVKDLRNTFFMCCFVMYAVNLFVRAPGYFAFSSFLFVSSMFWIFSSINKKEN